MQLFFKTFTRGQTLISYLFLISDVPDAPQNVMVGIVNRFGATVTWKPPLFDGGSEITSYVIELRDRTSVKWEPVLVVRAEDRTATLNDVVENKEYIFRVRAENRAGVGMPSAATDPVKIMDPIGKWSLCESSVYVQVIAQLF